MRSIRPVATFFPLMKIVLIVALGIGCDGRKTVLGIREGATENAAVVNALLRFPV